MYEKWNRNTQSDVLSLQFLQHTTVLLDAKIPTFPYDHTREREQITLLSDQYVSDYILLTNENLRNPPLLPFTSVKMPKEHRQTHFYCAIVAKLHSREDLAHSNSKYGISFRVKNEDKQIVVPEALQVRVLHL